MIMTLVRGPVLDLVWTKGRNSPQVKGSGSGIDLQKSIKGSLMITIGCLSWACFMVLQVRKFADFLNGLLIITPQIYDPYFFHRQSR